MSYIVDTSFRIGKKPESGYGGYSKLSNITIPVFNKVLAMAFIILGIPVFVIVAVIIKLRDKGPIFYKGVRLGMNKVPYIMYKFRTLPVGAQSVIGPRLLTARDFRLPWFSKFLRDTRLDELPQLINILKGDMDFIGPRPLRPEIYEKYCKNIPDYDLRFVVRPGMIGYSQLCTPHSTPKRIRALIDNRSIRLKRSLWWDIAVIFVTVLAVIKKTIVLLASGFWKYIVCESLLKLYKERRLYDRIEQKDAYVEIYDSYSNLIAKVPLVDINEEYFKVSAEVFPNINENEELLVKLFCRIRRNKRDKMKTAIAKARIYKQYQVSKNETFINHCVFHFIPNGEYYRYVVDQYFLKKSILHYF